MATNDFLTFAGDPAANAMTQTQYADAAFTARILGFATGTALSIQLNKVWRQASIMSHMIGQFTVDEINQDMLDDGTPGGIAALESHFRLAITHVAQSAVGTGYLPLVGGTLTGPLAINSANALQINAPLNQHAVFNLQRQAGMLAQLAAYTGPNARWALELADASPEQGGNTGSNFDILSFNDGGGYLETPLSINRATGVVNFAHNPTVNGTALPYVRLTGDIMSGPLGVGGTGISYNGMGGIWAAHRIAFGWDTSVECAVDGTYIGAIAMQGWVSGLVGGYLPLTGGVLTGALDIHAPLYISGLTWNRSTVYFSNLGDFSNFYDGRYRFRQWAGSWYDAWDGNTGLRIWAAPTAGWIMTLDGVGDLGIGGAFRTSNGRILSMNGSYAPSICAYWTQGVATGFWTDGSGMWLGNMDGAGNPADWHVAIGNDGFFTARSSGACYGNWWVGGQVTANGNLYVAGTSTLAGYVHCGGNGIQNDGPLTVNGGGYFGGSLRVNSDLSTGGTFWADHDAHVGQTVYASTVWSNQNVFAANLGDFYLGGDNATRILNFMSNWWWSFTGGNGLLRWNRDGQPMFDLQGDGTLVYWGSPAYKYGNGSWWGLSDARSKNIEGDFTDGLEKVRQLNPKRYRYRQEAAPENVTVPIESFIGLTAQDVEEIMPELVKTGPNPFSTKQHPDMRAMETTPLFFAMLNAIKELADKVEKIERIIT